MNLHTKKTTFTTLTLASFCIANSLGASSFEQQWRLMQEEYKNLNHSLDKQNIPNREKYCHPCWEGNQKSIRSLVLGNPNQNFLHTPTISSAMVRRGNSLFQRYEKTYISDCIAPQTKQLITSYQDTSVGLLPRECSEFNCSTNTLGCLFYAAKILDNPNKPVIKTIIDFGGGYGNLTRVFKTLLPDVTIFIIDLPELLAIQSLFLRSSLPDTKTYIHTQATQSYETGAIHLIPVYLLENLDLQTDLFVSTFALSETPFFVQDLVIRKNFFNATMCYVSGQLHGWNNFKFEQHNTVLNGIRGAFPSVFCQPFHHMLESAALASYEIIGLRDK